MSLQIISVTQPVVINANDEYVSADWLTVDFIETGSTIQVTATLAFDDYAGLEAEWNAGTATTVLDTSIQSWITGSTIQTSNDSTPSGGSGGGKGDSYTIV